MTEERLAVRQATSVSDAEFRAVLDERRLETVFQPILRLDSEEVVGYEALVRGPAATRFASAGSLLDAAYRSGRVVEFDWAARASACCAALAAGLTRETLLFLNVEPLALDSDCPRDLWPDIERGFASMRVVLEVTERSLDRDPRALLRGIDRQRPTVSGLALDDVGADTRTLAMLPVLAVDVVKLDLTVTQAGPTPTALKIIDQTYEEAERTGAAILAEGVETAAHATFARTVGASMGQGRFFGEAGPLPAAQPGRGRRLSPGRQLVPDLSTPFDALPGRLIGRATERLLRPLAHHLAFRGDGLTEPALLLMALPRVDLLGSDDRHHLARAARRGVITSTFGPGMPAEPAPGVRGVDLAEPDVRGQWAVVALSPSTAVAMLARAVAGSMRDFEYGVTHDRRRVIAAARCLLRRLGPGVDGGRG